MSLEEAPARATRRMIVRQLDATRPDAELIAGVIECLRSIADSAERVAAATEAERPGELLTAEELATRLRIPARTIKDQASAGRLPHHRLGKHYRFSTEDIAEILRLTRQQPTSRRTRTGATRVA